MATAFDAHGERPALPGRCDCTGRARAVAITTLSPDGCVIEADDVWEEACDFVHLRIAGTVDMNGRLAWVRGRRAGMRFFGQIHPAAIAKLVPETSS